MGYKNKAWTLKARSFFIFIILTVSDGQRYAYEIPVVDPRVGNVYTPVRDMLHLGGFERTFPTNGGYRHRQRITTPRKRLFEGDDYKQVFESFHYGSRAFVEPFRRKR